MSKFLGLRKLTKEDFKLGDEIVIGGEVYVKKQKPLSDEEIEASDGTAKTNLLPKSKFIWLGRGYVAHADNLDDVLVINGIVYIKKQNPLSEPEPVAWMSLSDIEWMNIVNHPKILELTDGRHNSEEAVNLAVKMTEEKCKKNNSDSMPKREPLTPHQISEGNQSMLNVTREAFVKGIKFAEKAHGITGENDE